jgi:hypothetical protein
MMKGSVYAKTDKGREEIATRKYRLPAKLRALLLLIDGQRSLDTLANSVGLPELTAANAASLLRDGYIALLAKAAPAPGRSPPPALATRPAPREEPPSPVSMHDIYASRRRF